MKHITSACPILAKEKHIKRHDRVCTVLHFNMMQGNRGKITQRTLAWKYKKNLVETSHEGKVTILSNQKVRSDLSIPNNKLDNTIPESNKGTCMLIDVALLGDRKIIKKEAEKIFIYSYIKLTVHVTKVLNTEQLQHYRP